MYTRFYDNTIETKFVKQLVATTNVPFISTWKPGDFAIRGMLYLSRDAIWKCNHTGFPKDFMDKCTLRKDQVNGVVANYGSHVEMPYFTKVSTYYFGEECFNITGKYTSKMLGYDSETHFYLGQYLRMLRDIFDLNLMPFYNCYCDESVSDVDFSDNGKVVAKKHSNLYKILSVPVKFGKTYTIAFNSELPVETILAIYGKKGLIKDKTDNLNDIGGGNSTYQRFNKMSFTHPILIHTKSWHQLYNSYTLNKYGGVMGASELDEDSRQMIDDKQYDQSLGQYERYLRLLIKVPKTNNSSIVVLEGDYGVGQTQEVVNTNNVTFTNMSIVDATVNSKLVSGEQIRPTYVQNYDNDNGLIQDKKSPLLSPLGLLQLSDGNNYAFSNRLIEYLLQNVINPLESFDQNIKRIQTYATSTTNEIKNGSRFKGAFTYGVWDDRLREYLFNLSINSNSIEKKVDMTGYVDKDVESVITRGQSV